MTTYKPGQWNAICDRCGFKFKSAELRKDWQGLMVCEEDFETRHPQSLLRVKTEKAFPEWTRPQTEDAFLNFCYIWSSSSYSDLGTADCMTAEYTPFPYITLLELKGSNG